MTLLSQIDLARSLGMNRKTIARHLSALEDNGLIRREENLVVILISDEAAFWKDDVVQGFGASWTLPERFQ